MLCVITTIDIHICFFLEEWNFRLSCASYNVVINFTPVIVLCSLRAHVPLKKFVGDSEVGLHYL